MGSPIVRIASPTRAYLEDFSDPLGWIDEQLRYEDQKVQHDLRRLKRPGYAAWFVKEHGEEEWDRRVAELKSKIVRPLIYQDENGRWTHPGLVPMILDQFPQARVVRDHGYPDPGLLAWRAQPKRTPRPYQLEIRDRLIEAKHGAVEVGTGLGKSICALLIVKELGLRTLVMAPSTSIARQLYKDFAAHFGDARVGLYGDGRKDVGKLITVGISASLTKIDPGSKAWEWLSGASVFIVDESHLCPADTLERVCTGLAALAPYRMFFSGTQMRADGRDLLLKGIIGEIVFRMTVREGVEQGYLARPISRMLTVWSPSSKVKADPNDNTRLHLYSNPRVNRIAGVIARQMVESKRQVLILIDEMQQFADLLPHLPFQVGFAHGGVTASNARHVPSEYHKSDPEKLVDLFNAGAFPVLVGTSCISTGTDVRANGATINLQGGQSEVQVRQGAIGRSTRGGRLGGVKNPWTGELKEDCYVFDFMVKVPGVDDVQPEPGQRRQRSTTMRHALARAAVYEDAYPDFQIIEESP